MRHKKILLLVMITIFLFLCGCSKTVKGTWESQHTSAFLFDQTNGVHGSTITFTGKKFTLFHPFFSNTFGIDVSDSGTYSITGDKMEMIFADGTIKVFDFSRTENTITISGTQFTRRR